MQAGRAPTSSSSSSSMAPASASAGNGSGVPRKNSNGGSGVKSNSNSNSVSGKKKKTPEKGKLSNGQSKDAAGGEATASAPPGFAPQPAPTAAPSSAGGLSEAHQRLLRHRALFAFRFLVGKMVDVQLVDASRYVGILDCIDPDDFSIVLKNTHRKSESEEPFASGSTVIFKRLQMAHMSADGVVNYNDSSFGAGLPFSAASGSIRTDTEISGRQPEHLFGRELQTASSWLDPQLDSGDLEDPRRRSAGKAGWNQFDANEKLFGVVSSFDENLYTTKLDKTKIPNDLSRQAERIAMEIERQTTSNFHLQEERGQANAQRDGLDEEARYSSVDRKDAASAASRSPNTYVPPALRNAQRQVSGGKNNAKPNVMETTKPAVATLPHPAPTTAKAPSSATAPKPLSFSDAVLGRTSAAVPKPDQPTAPAANGKDTNSEAKSVTTTLAGNKSSEPASTTTKDTSTPLTSAVSTGGATDDAAKTTTAAAPAKKGLNPNAKEFKLSASAAAFTPKSTPPVATVPQEMSSPYRGGMHPPPHMMHQQMPPIGGMMYSPMPEEWMYEGMVAMEDGEMIPPHYMGYGMPMAPNGAVMQQQMYPPMMHQQQNTRMMGGQRGGYGYQHPAPYNPRGGYYAQAAGIPGGMPYAVSPGGMSPGPQPPLPREPTPTDSTAVIDTAPDVVPASPSAASNEQVPSAPTGKKSAAAKK